MDTPSFAPVTFTTDRISSLFLKLTRWVLVAAIVLLPLLFIPGAAVLLGVSKVMLMVAAVLLALITYSLYVLRRGSISLRFPPVLLAWWGVVLAASIAGLMAPQMKIAFLGLGLEIHTIGFLILGGVLMTMMMLFRDAKPTILYLYAGLFGVALVLGTLHIIRVLFGADVLTLGVLGAPTDTLIGSFNDLALFFTLVIIVGLIALVQLTLPRLVEGVLAAIMVVALVMLSIINFFTVWIILGLFGLLLLMYTLTKGRIGTTKSTSAPSTTVTLLSLGVCILATVFIIGGTSLGAFLTDKTGVTYLEVRPSLTATLDILQSVYSTDALTGAGPNHFNEAWTKYKDQSLNTTLFWNTPFSAGNGYITSWFVTGGILAVVAWLSFLGLFLYSGARTLLRASEQDHFWYFIATVSFTSALFVWGIALLYVPGSVILTLGFVSTGLFIVASEALSQKSSRTVNLLTNARTGFILIALVMVVIIGTVAVGYQAVRQFASITTFTSALTVAPGENQAAEVTARVAEAYMLYQTDTYLRDVAAYQLSEMRLLAANQSPTPAETERFRALLTAAIESSSVAIEERGSDARNWAIRGDVYTVLASAQVEGAYDRAMADYNEAKLRDPNNPYYDLQMAVLELSRNNNDGVRSGIAAALAKKPNYTDALMFLTELDIAAGNIDEAIRSTESLIAIESTNPGRYYQLGVLYSAKANREMAVAAFTAAIELNPQYANARYLRALEYLALGNTEAAVTELAVVRDLNPDNAAVSGLIGQIERGEVTPETITGQQSTPVAEPSSVTTTEGDVTTAETAPDTDLLTPVNTVPEAPADTEETQ
jgi:tetratricopeptide (TPR) repeat protein